MPAVSGGQFPTKASDQITAFDRDFNDVSDMADNYINNLLEPGRLVADRMSEQAATTYTKIDILLGDASGRYKSMYDRWIATNKEFDTRMKQLRSAGDTR